MSHLAATLEFYWAVCFKQSVRGLVHAPLLDAMARICNQGTGLLNEGNREEAVRKLGIVQGFFIAHGIFSVTELDAHWAEGPPT